MDFLQQAVEFLGNPLVKYALMLIGGLILKRAPSFNNKAIPFVNLLFSTITAILNTMFGAHAGVMPATFETAAIVVAAESSRSWWQSFLFDALLPWLAATGTHSAAKNTKQLLAPSLK